MSEFYTFAGEHYIVFLLLVYTVYVFLRIICNRILRTINVVTRGWPPPHLDADGDWRPVGEKVAEEQDDIGKAKPAVWRPHDGR